MDEYVKRINELQATIEKRTKMCKDYVYNLQADLEAKENDIRQLKNELEKGKAAN